MISLYLVMVTLTLSIIWISLHLIMRNIRRYIELKHSVPTMIIFGSGKLKNSFQAFILI